MWLMAQKKADDMLVNHLAMVRGKGSPLHKIFIEVEMAKKTQTFISFLRLSCYPSPKKGLI